MTPRTANAVDVLPSPLTPPLDDEAALIRLISKVSGQDQVSVWERLCAEERELGLSQRADAAQFGLEPHRWTDASAVFYEQRCSLVGQATWNRRPTKLEMRAWTGGFLRRRADRPWNILCVGDGAGYDSLYLARCGHRVTYNDASMSNIEFAQRIFADAGLPVRACTRLEELQLEEFDAILCLDVLEHLPEPPQFVAQLSNCLKPGGLFIVHAPFYFVTRHNPTHLAANRKYAGAWGRLYTANGLLLEDGRLAGNPLVFRKLGANVQASLNLRARRAAIRAVHLMFRLSQFVPWPIAWLAARAMQRRDDRMLQRLEAARPVSSR